MTAKKKKAKVSTRRASQAAAKSEESPGLSDGQFVEATFDQVEEALKRATDWVTKTALTERLKAMRTKFKALPKNKVTRERCERYMEEITKIGREIAGSA